MHRLVALRLAAPLGVLLMAAGCAGLPGPTDGPIAVATVAPTAGNTAAGTVRFTQRGSRTLIHARLTGLTPNAEHGFHVHERGDCSAPDASSAGEHFNPGGQPHAFHAQAQRHAGDLPNLRADAQGAASLSWESELLSVDSGPRSVAGRSVIVHRNADDYRSQPAGNSGPRLGCGVVRAG